MVTKRGRLCGPKRHGLRRRRAASFMAHGPKRGYATTHAPNTYNGRCTLTIFEQAALSQRDSRKEGRDAASFAYISTEFNMKRKRRGLLE